MLMKVIERCIKIQSTFMHKRLKFASNCFRTHELVFARIWFGYEGVNKWSVLVFLRRCLGEYVCACHNWGGGERSLRLSGPGTLVSRYAEVHCALNRGCYTGHNELTRVSRWESITRSFRQQDCHSSCC